MRRPRTAGGGLVCISLALAGCFWTAGNTRTTALLDPAAVAPTAGEGGVYLTSRLLERPAGDPFLTTGLWDEAGKPVPHEKAALLARNGLRVGVLTGMVPPEFDALVRSERTAIDARLQTTRPGQAKVVAVNGPLEQCAYAVLPDLVADPVRAELAGAECGLSVTATPAADGCVRLACEFHVQHGDKQAWLRPTSDGSGFTRTDRKPLETYPTLGFAVTLGPGDFLAVGPTADPAGTLGEAFFLAGGGERVRQRVLVLQAGRAEAARPAGAVTPARAALQP